MRLLQRLWAERPDLAARWFAEIDQEEWIHRAQALLEEMSTEPMQAPEAEDDVDRSAQDGPEEGSP